MARYACAECSHEGHFVEFKVDTGAEVDTEHDDDDDDDVDEVQCPSCGSQSVYET